MHKKWSFPLKIYSTGEILNGKLFFVVKYEQIYSQKSGAPYLKK